MTKICELQTIVCAILLCPKKDIRSKGELGAKYRRRVPRRISLYLFIYLLFFDRQEAYQLINPTYAIHVLFYLEKVTYQYIQDPGLHIYFS